MDLFASDEEVTRLEGLLVQQSDQARLPTLVALAWHLRQRDTRRALGLADQAQQWLAHSDAQSDSVALEPARQIFVARLLLVCAEAKWLAAQLDEAVAMVHMAQQQFASLGDATGWSDCHWSLGNIAHDRGQIDLTEQEFERALALARQAGDGLRIGILEAVLAFAICLRDSERAEQGWGQRFHTDLHEAQFAVHARICDYLGLHATLSSDFGAAASYFIRAFDASIKTGQIRRAILASLNAGDAFAGLNDHHTAMEWMQRALDLARHCGWQSSIGVSLMQTAETLRRLGRFEAAQELLLETLEILAHLPESRAYAVALSYVADLALDLGQPDYALQNFEQLDVRAKALRQPDLQIDVQRGRAHALARLGKCEQALAAAYGALAMAQQHHDAAREISVWRVFAFIHECDPDLSRLDTRMDAKAGTNPVLYYLKQALAVSHSIEGYTVPVELLDAIARQYAAQRDFTQAYAISLQAIASREKIHSQQATNRAVAMQVRHRTERAQSEREHHRQLALSEAQRVQVLHQNSVTLEHLGAIGQEITAQLHTDAVLQSLNRHVQGLLDVSGFAIFLLDASGQTLSLAFGVENERLLEIAPFPLSSKHASVARCVRERCEILCDFPALSADTQLDLAPGTVASASGLYAPLMIGERVLGAMTIQSLQRQAYGERECLIFRTLCAYGAIALGNACAYQQLQQTQIQLVEQEKLVALGSLVAGVAHEINTPIGNSLMMASALQEKTDVIERALDGQALQFHQLRDFILDAKEASAVILRGLTNASQLVNSFKQVALDRASAQRRIFDLQQTSQEVIATLMNQIRLAGHCIECEIEPNILLDSYPGPYGQVLSNFINNALLHAFDEKIAGVMRLSASLSASSSASSSACLSNAPGEPFVEIRFEDNGVGINAQHLGRIFDPFFTTKMGRGGNGLGLYTSYNIVTSLLNGQIEVQSQLGQGTCFTVLLPLTAPRSENHLS